MFIKGEIHTNMLFLCYCSCYTQFKSGSNSRRKGAEEMRLIGNILWIIFGGFISALGWLLTGCLWCITIIGIPVGLQCFKLASISLNPFGKEIRYEGEAVSFLLNVIWFLVSGRLLALGQLPPGTCPVHHDCRNPIWKTVFQDREAGAASIRSRCSTNQCYVNLG